MSYFIACDIDHTLLDDAGNLLEVNVRALKRAQDAGSTVVLATARSYSGAKPIHDALNLDTPLVVSNGTLVMDPSGVALMAQTLDPGTAKVVVDLFKESPHHWSFRTQEAAYVHPGFDRSRPPFDNSQHYRPTDPEALEEQLGGYSGLVTASLFGLPLREFFDRHSWEEMALSADFYPPSHYTPLEALSVMRPGATKGTAVAWLRDYLELANLPTLAIGDSLADATMFDLGTGVAPANALPSVRVQADWIAPHCDEGAVAAALERFVLDPVKGAGSPK